MTSKAFPSSQYHKRFNLLSNNLQLVNYCLLVMVMPKVRILLCNLYKYFFAYWQLFRDLACCQARNQFNQGLYCSSNGYRKFYTYKVYYLLVRSYNSMGFYKPHTFIFYIHPLGYQCLGIARMNSCSRELFLNILFFLIHPPPSYKATTNKLQQHEATTNY